MTTFGLPLQQDVTCLPSRLDKIQTEKKHKRYLGSFCSPQDFKVQDLERSNLIPGEPRERGKVGVEGRQRGEPAA